MDAYSVLTSFLLVTVAVVLTVYCLFVQKMKKIIDAGIPCYKPGRLIAKWSAVLLRRKTIKMVIDDVYYMEPEAKYVGYYDVSSPIILLRDLDLIKSITIKNFDHFPNHNFMVRRDVEEPLLCKNLITLQGDRWKHMRNILSPAFTSSKMKSMFNLMVDCAKDFTDSLAEISNDYRVVDMKDVFARYTNDVIATCAFGISINSMKNRENDFYTIGKESNFLRTSALTRMIIMNLFPTVAKIFGIRVLKKHVEDFFKDIIQTTMRVRDEKGIYRPDVIQLLMETRGKLGEGKELSIEDMTSQAFVFFFGGFESTSNCMCFLAHEIATHPEVYERLQSEVDRVMEETGEKLTYEAVGKMEYLDAVINEILRLYPLAPILERRCLKPFELPPTLPGRKSFVIDETLSVWVPTISIHRDPKYFENPEQFNPDRFLDKEKNLANHPAYTPFGLGPRMCIGNRFALLEIKIVFCHLLRKCELRVCDETVIPMKFSKGNFTLTADGGFWLNVLKRNRNPSLNNLGSCIDTVRIKPNFWKTELSKHFLNDS